MIKVAIVATALTIFSSACSGADAAYDVIDDDHSDEVVQDDDQLIDNGDGTFSVPESWLENVVELEGGEATFDVVNKSAGADPRSGVGPNLLSKNFTYTLTLPYTGSPSGPITSIPYTWSLGSIPAGLVVLLCRNTAATCATVTGAQSGTANTFNNQQSNVPMLFLFRVNGAGALPLVQGKSDQVIINHS